MKALELLKDYRNIDFGCNMEGLHNEIDEAIKELEELQEKKSLVKTLEKMNEEMIDLRKENQDLKSRSCNNCKHYKQSSSQDYKSCYEIKINGFNFESEKDFYCKNWEQK